jgi:hypothetical protein
MLWILAEAAELNPLDQPYEVQRPDETLEVYIALPTLELLIPRPEKAPSEFVQVSIKFLWMSQGGLRR